MFKVSDLPNIYTILESMKFEKEVEGFLEQQKHFRVIQKFYESLIKIMNKKTHIGTVKPYIDCKFHDIDCMEGEDDYGFFRSEYDVRPSQAIYLKKEDAERIYELFSN